jgi:prepilin-type N-terminal cleavage/methylation domain-containing protein
MMNADRRRNAFTLIEVLIVVVIMAVLAATVIPQFTSSTKDAQNSTVEFNARTLRAQIELYKAHHNGAYPDLTTGANLSQLTAYTNADGATSTTKDDSHPFGPYVAEIPKNPFNAKNTVTATTDNPPAAGIAGDASGWQYNETTGGIWPAHKDWTSTTTTAETKE